MNMRTFNIEKDDTQLTAHWRHYDNVVFIVVFFLLAWTIPCLLITQSAVAEKRLLLFLVPLPFWACWGLMLYTIVDMYFGETRFHFGEEGFVTEYIFTEYICLFLKRKKCLPLADIYRFINHIQRRSKGRMSFYLRVLGHEKKIDVHIPGDRSAVDDLCKQLNGLLVKFNPVTESHLGPFRFESHIPPQNIERPKRTPWKHESDFDEFRFERRGVFSPGSFFLLLFIAAFCNFVVSLFVLTLCGFGPPEKVPHGVAWWMMFFILIPFAIVGLSLLLAFVSEILEPFRVTKWTFRYGEAAHRFVKHVFYRTATFPLTGWHSLSVRLSCNEKDEDSDDDKFYEDGEFWQLAFLDKSGADLVVIDSLRKSEALWMTDVVLRERRTIR